ncbi:hypothetical protein V475_11630 [Sphingobium baderi LL03]|uniref:Enoyl-CoA hydratase n=2 Tax=Sphingobium baderi TaxID=1332080 RepID=T0GEW5_9SPHN|nr:hypothetical protein L485_18095 [Sphingobium baderi LL03]KMS61748.1 hypothetical protein V475_11630 [Sphingobium baderi LL03]
MENMVTQVRTSVEDRIGTVLLDGPDRMNAISVETTDQLLLALEELGNSPDVGVIVITGSGRAFSAGGDVKVMHDMTSMTYENYLHIMQPTQRLPGLIRSLPRVVIAQLNGVAAGAGLAIAAACDMRIAGASARFTTAFGKVGFSGDCGISWTLTRLVGTAKAREMMLLGEMLGAEEALKLGLINKLVADDALEADTRAIAARIANGPVVAYQYMKANLLAAETEPLQAVVNLEAMHQTRAFMTDDHREAIAAFAEKRAPCFAGR